MIEEIPRRKIWIIGIIIICVIVVLVLFLVSRGKEIEVVCEEIENELLRGHCEFCKGLEDSRECADTLYMNLGILNEDESLCRQVKDRDKENDCLSTIVAKRAVREEDIEGCDKLNQDAAAICRDKFFYFKSRQEGNKGLCEEISDKFAKDLCLRGGLIPRPKPE